MMEFIDEFFERLDSVGYIEFEDKNHEKTVKLIQSHLYPPNLRAAIAQHIEYHQGLKKNFKSYMKLLLKEAVVQHKVVDHGSKYSSKSKLGASQAEKAERLLNFLKTTGSMGTRRAQKQTKSTKSHHT